MYNNFGDDQNQWDLDGMDKHLQLMGDKPTLEKALLCLELFFPIPHELGVLIY